MGTDILIIIAMAVLAVFLGPWALVIGLALFVIGYYMGSPQAQEAGATLAVVSVAVLVIGLLGVTALFMSPVALAVLSAVGAVAALAGYRTGNQVVMLGGAAVLAIGLACLALSLLGVLAPEAEAVAGALA